MERRKQQPNSSGAGHRPHSTAYPVLWGPLDKHTDERILLLELFLNLFAKNQIATPVADREVVGKTWLAWLNTNRQPFSARPILHFANNSLKNPTARSSPLWPSQKIACLRTAKF